MIVQDHVIVHHVVEVNLNPLGGNQSCDHGPNVAHGPVMGEDHVDGPRSQRHERDLDQGAVLRNGAIEDAVDHVIVVTRSAQGLAVVIVQKIVQNHDHHPRKSLIYHQRGRSPMDLT